MDLGKRESLERFKSINKYVLVEGSFLSLRFYTLGISPYLLELLR